uniref:Uncharacterized protein n=1 Tax=Peronospora matthiolae TaxID=2874970 RepID=A0AAV1VF52_9STRA
MDADVDVIDIEDDGHDDDAGYLSIANDCYSIDDGATTDEDYFLLAERLV